MINAFSVVKSCVLVVNCDKKVFCEGQKDKKMNFRENGLWLMSEWEFEPAEWGGIGFPHVDSQNKLTDGGERAGAIVAIWIATSTKVTAARRKKKKVVGFVELSGNTNDISKFISWDILVKHLQKPENKDRWRYAVEVKRAWKIAEESWGDVCNVFENTYDPNKARPIGTDAKRVETTDFASFERLRCYEVSVFGQEPLLAESEITTVEAIFRNAN